MADSLLAGAYYQAKPTNSQKNPVISQAVTRHQAMQANKTMLGCIKQIMCQHHTHQIPSLGQAYSHDQYFNILKFGIYKLFEV